MTDMPPPPPPSEPQGWGPPPAYATTPPPAQHASWGARLGAYLIDGLVSVLFFLPAIIFFFAGPKKDRLCHVNTGGGIEFGGYNNAICRGPSGATIAIAGLLYLIGIVAYVIFRARAEGSTGQTIGKKALGIKTVDATTGQPIGTGRAVGRFFSYIISGFICDLGFLWALWDPNKQAWHDKIVSTVVVKA